VFTDVFVARRIGEKLHPTKITRVRRLARVCSFMLRHPKSPGKTMTAVLTLVRFVASVRARVAVDATFKCESSVTELALVRFFTSMNSLVNAESPALGEPLPTRLAAVTSVRVLLHVLSEEILVRK
jgi:hypothetical protein